MGAIKIDQFSGMLPAWDIRLLPSDQASFARDTYLLSGALTGWRQPKLLRALTNSAAKFAYRIPTQSSSIAAAYLAFTANPTAGQSITVGEQTYTFRAAVSAAFDVLLGADATHSAQNLFGALTLNGVFGQQFGLGTCLNSAIAPNSPYAGLPWSNVATTNTPGAGTLILLPVEPGGTQKVTNVAILPSSTNAGAKFTGVVYSNNAGVPGSVVVVGAEVVGCIAGTPIVSTFATPPTLEGGTTYWIGFIMDSAISFHLADAGTNGSLVLNTYASGVPNPAPSNVSVLQVDWQMWADLTLLQPSDPELLLGTHDFGSGAIPLITVQAPDIGAAYNVTPVTSTTSNMVWLKDTASLSDTTITLQGGANQTENTTITGASTWLEFLDPDTNVMKSPILDDAFQRYYFASPSLPPQYNTYDRIVNGLPPWLLGVPAPGCSPSLAVTGGGNASTIGFPTSATGNTSTPGANTIIFFQVTPAGAMQLTDISIMPAGTSSTANFLGVLYSDNNGVPGTFIAQGSQITGCTGGTIVSSPFAIPPGLLTAVPYWIGMMTDTATAVQLADSTGTTGFVGSATYTNGPPVDAPAVTSGQPDWQMWADVTTQAVLETRAYVYTWVTAYGEEGPPSPPTVAQAWSNSVWSVGMFTPAEDDMGGVRNITTTNLYRTVSGTSGQTTYFFVATFDVHTATYVDTIDDSIVAAGAELASTNWSPPPVGLQGIMAMPNGMAVGFRANEIWFCEPFRPHAWPPGYVITTTFPIVGIGVAGQSVVAGTAGNPTIAYGPSPAAMTEVSVRIAEPCLSRGSIVSTDAGVAYMSPNGLIQVSASGQASNTTEGWIKRDDWQVLVPQKNVRAVRHVAYYFAFGTTNGGDDSVAQEGFTIEMALDNSNFTIWPQAGGHRIGFNELSSPNGFNIDNVIVDPWTGIVVLLQNEQLYYYDFSDQSPAIVPYKWRSKTYQQGSKKNFEGMRLFFDIPPGSASPPATRTTALPFQDIALTSTMYGVVRVFADTGDGTGLQLVCAREMRETGELMRITSGFKGEFWAWEVEARVILSNLQAATTVTELRQI